MNEVDKLMENICTKKNYKISGFVITEVIKGG